MIVSRTPYRVSFFGGGTDYPEWYRVHGGSVLAASINKYCYISCRYLPPFFEHRYRIVYSQIESRQTVDEIEHPAVRAVLKQMDVQRGIEIHHDGDLPARSGMGSSSSFTVGLIHAIHALRGSMPSRKQLASESTHIEQKILKETVGGQDQIMAAHGGFNHVTFTRSGEIIVKPLTISPERLAELNSHFMLFYTGVQRIASIVAKTYVNEIDKQETQLLALGRMVDQGIDVLRNGNDITEFGQLLHEAWQTKKSLSPNVSIPIVDEIYQQARQEGAIGGKLLGAGGGGFLLLFVRPQDQLRVRDRLKGLVHVPFKVESSGSQIIFFDPEEDYALEDQLHLDRAVTAMMNGEETR